MADPHPTFRRHLDSRRHCPDYPWTSRIIVHLLINNTVGYTRSSMLTSSSAPSANAAAAAPSSLYSLETYGELNPYLSYEWLLTNGLGGFAFSSVVGCNTRRYHGLLCSAIKPPVGRVMTLNRVGEILTLDNKHDQTLEFSSNQ